jgi:hypothetical protein
MISRRAFVALSVPLWLRAARQPLRPERPIPLFNGRNLDGLYTWLEHSKYDDPKRVFTVVDGQLRITGEEWGGIATRQDFRDYRLVAEWRWGGLTFEPRKDKARDSGILIHGVGEDGAYGGKWIQSYEYQIIEGGTGDFILVGGKEQPRLTCDTRPGKGKELHWQKGGLPVTRDRGRFNWYGRDPDWQDVLGFRGRDDVERPIGEWNLSEVLCDGDRIVNKLNGVVVNEGYNASQTAGRIMIQSEGAEIFFRKLELLPLR